MKKKVVVILNNIRSNENVGSIFRTCDAVGVSKIFLCGYTPAPLDRFGRDNQALTKASLGAEKFVEWQKAESLKDVVMELRNHFSPLANARTSVSSKSRSKKDFEAQEFKIIGIEQSKNSIDYKDLKTSKLLASSSKLAFVFGNEVDGLSVEDLVLCDVVAEIPMQGKKESLNVAVAVGVVLFSLL